MVKEGELDGGIERERERERKRERERAWLDIWVRFLLLLAFLIMDSHPLIDGST